MSKNVKIATARCLNISVKENKRIASEMAQLSNESSAYLDHDLVLPEDIDECEFSVTPKSNIKLIKKRLRLLSIDILSNMEQRIQIPRIIKLASKAFDLSHSDKNEIHLLIDCLDGNKSEMYREFRNEIAEGYKLFINNFAAENSRNETLSLEKYYILFCEKFDFDETSLFRDFFEYLNVRTYSEALCETIGSLMALAFATGRSLHPPNLYKEVFIRFNSAPFHILQKKFIPKVTKRWIDQGLKTFKRKGDGDHRQMRKLKHTSVSATIGNHRAKEEKITMLPLHLFN